MKILKKDYKKGFVKLKVETNEDVWTLSKIINKGDLVSGSTTRVIKKEEREGKRRRVFLKIKVEKVEFREATFILKALGKIIQGPEEVPLGNYHSFNIQLGSKIIIEKEDWSAYAKKKLINSQRKPSKLLVTIIDSRRATHALLNNTVKKLFSHHPRLPRKDHADYNKKMNEYYKEVAEQISDLMKNHEINQLVIAGPGFAPEELTKLCKSSGLNPFKAHINHTGIAGIKELINSGLLDKLIKESEISDESKIVNKFFTQLSKDKLIKYGLDQVSKAVKAGAVKVLLISEGLITDFRKRKRFKEIENIINIAEKMNTKIEFIGIKHELGRQFYRFGGIGAILRYEI